MIFKPGDYVELLTDSINDVNVRAGMRGVVRGYYGHNQRVKDGCVVIYKLTGHWYETTFNGIEGMTAETGMRKIPPDDKPADADFDWRDLTQEVTA